MQTRGTLPATSTIVCSACPAAQRFIQSVSSGQCFPNRGPGRTPAANRYKVRSDCSFVKSKTAGMSKSGQTRAEPAFVTCASQLHGAKLWWRVGPLHGKAGVILGTRATSACRFELRRPVLNGALTLAPPLEQGPQVLFAHFGRIQLLPRTLFHPPSAPRYPSAQRYLLIVSGAPPVDIRFSTFPSLRSTHLFHILSSLRRAFSNVVAAATDIALSRVLCLHDRQSITRAPPSFRSCQRNGLVPRSSVVRQTDELVYPHLV